MVPTPKDSDNIHRTQTIDLIQRYWTYDKTFWIIPQTNHLHCLFQKIICPTGAEQVLGTHPLNVAHSFF
ncbi:hypothetical protein JVU11DRAFT_11765 [Chiua virens]|nr:hypothetical protein JVU11DRAFT_11765 [Chiua virens]